MAASSGGNAVNFGHLSRRQIRVSLAARFLLFAAAVLLFSAKPASAQIFELRGGSSTQFGASGGALDIFAGRYTAEIGFGLLDRPRFGLLLKTKIGNNIWSAGDQAVPFNLATDLMSQSYVFLSRGLSLARQSPDSKLFISAGATSTGFVVPFLTAARAESGSGMVFYERRISSTVRLISQNIISSRLTSIQSVEWKPRPNLALALAGGAGNSQGYAALSLKMDRGWISLLAGYTRAGRDFRRVRLLNQPAAETDRENIILNLMPLRFLRFTVSRQNFLSPDSNNHNIRATENGLSVSGGVFGLQMHSALFESISEGRHITGTQIGANRNIAGKVDLGMEYLRSTSGANKFSSLLFTVGEIVTRRVRLSQVINYTAHQASIGFGGGFNSNLFTLSAGYQTIFVPFYTPGQPAFRQVLALNLQLRLPHDLALATATDVSPLGKVRYTVYGTQFAYRNQAGAPESYSPRKVFGRYIVRGRVIGQNGQPVAGAAIEIGGLVVFSDSTGSFFLRQRKPGLSALHVLLDQFTQPGIYEVISAPPEVHANIEPNPEVCLIQLRRVPSRKS